MMNRLPTMSATAASALLLLASLTCAACSKTDSAPTPTTLSSADAATPVAAVGSAAAVALPTPEDYEPAATKKVTAANLDSQLDALEKEIAATPK
jgi:hypothetical protein